MVSSLFGCYMQTTVLAVAFILLCNDTTMCAFLELIVFGALLY